MGMDVFGKKPDSYFRRSVWGWRPLADYILDQAPHTLTQACTYWHSNDGDGLDDAGSRRLAAWLREQVSSGAAAAYVEARDEGLSLLPDQACHLCGGTGVRRDCVGVQHGQTKRVIDEPDHPRHGQTGWCNGCNGVGHKRPMETWYSLEVQDIQEFADFLETCGGFRIC